MGSSRLPGKVLKPLANIPLIEHIYTRIMDCVPIDSVVLATTENSNNNKLVDHCKNLGMQVYRDPNENDIASRLFLSARSAGADAILKVNADCPLVDPVILNRIITAFIQNDNIDYVSNKVIWSFPEGYSAEIISYEALKWCHENLKDELDRELVANFIKNDKKRFTQISIENDQNEHAPFPHFCVDTPKDYELMAKIFDDLYSKDQLFGWPMVRDWWKNNNMDGKI